MNKLLLHLRTSNRTVGLAMAGMLLGAGLMLNSSCVRRDLYTTPNEGQVAFEIDWKNIVPGDQAPDKASIYIYKEDGTSERVVSADNGIYEGTLPSGKFKLLMVSEDQTGTGLTAMDTYDGAQITALESSKAVGGLEGYTQLQDLDWAYGMSYAEVEVPKNDTLRQILTPVPLMQHVTLNVAITGDYSSVTGVEAALTGVARAKYLASRDVAQGYASVAPLLLEDVSAGATQKDYKATTLIFGVDNKAGDVQMAPRVVVGVAFNNGGSQNLVEDLTGSGIEDGMSVELDIDVDIEVSKTGTGEFTAKVTSWEVTQGGVVVER